MWRYLTGRNGQFWLARQLNTDSQSFTLLLVQAGSNRTDSGACNALHLEKLQYGLAVLILLMQWHLFRLSELGAESQCLQTIVSILKDLLDWYSQRTSLTVAVGSWTSICSAKPVAR